MLCDWLILNSTAIYIAVAFSLQFNSLLFSFFVPINTKKNKNCWKYFVDLHPFSQPVERKYNHVELGINPVSVDRVKSKYLPSIYKVCHNNLAQVTDWHFPHTIFIFYIKNHNPFSFDRFHLKDYYHCFTQRQIISSQVADKPLENFSHSQLYNNFDN